MAEIADSLENDGVRADCVGIFWALGEESSRRTSEFGL